MIRIVFLLCLLLPAAAFSTKNEYKTDAIRVLADSSLAPVMTELSRRYAEKNGISVIFTFDSAAELSRQIEAGEAADVFIADHPKWIEGLKQKGVLDIYSIHPIARNRLVLALPSNSLLLKRLPSGREFGRRLTWLQSRTLFVLADPDSASLGIYTQESLESVGQWKGLQGRVIKAANSQQATILTASNNAAGILYASDITPLKGVEKVADIPEILHKPIIYTAAAVASENMTHARKFLEFLSSKEVQPVYEKHGMAQ